MIWRLLFDMFSWSEKGPWTRDQEWVDLWPSGIRNSMRSWRRRQVSKWPVVAFLNVVARWAKFGWTHLCGSWYFDIFRGYFDDAEQEFLKQVPLRSTEQVLTWIDRLRPWSRTPSDPSGVKWEHFREHFKFPPFFPGQETLGGTTYRQHKWIYDILQGP